MSVQRKPYFPIPDPAQRRAYQRKANLAPSPSASGHVPSSPRRSRVTCADADARLPDVDDTRAVVVRNREARRIVERLRMPGRTAEALLGILTCRFADGREIALGEFPLAGVLSGAETVRAEEIVLITPDGRSITTLVNATPIHAEDGAVASVVVTMQDLAPLQALERMRAEFLGMVSHELRVPITSIKGSTAAGLGGARHFAPAETREFFRIVDDQADRMLGLIADLLGAGRIDTGTLSVSPEPTEVALLVDRARGRAHRHRVRAAARALAQCRTVATYETLLHRVREGRSDGDTKVVRAFVKQLRRKLGDAAASPAWVINVRGVGYRMARPGEARDP